MYLYRLVYMYVYMHTLADCQPKVVCSIGVHDVFCVLYIMNEWTDNKDNDDDEEHEKEEEEYSKRKQEIIENKELFCYSLVILCPT